MKKMDGTTIIILICIGIVAGFLGGLVGIGGGLIIVPALTMILGLTQLQAQGNSLALIMFPVGFLAVLQYYKTGNVNFKYVLFIAIGFILGSFMGGKLVFSPVIKENIKKIFAVFMILAAVKMLFFDKPKTNLPQTTNSDLSK